MRRRTARGARHSRRQLWPHREALRHRCRRLGQHAHNSWRVAAAALIDDAVTAAADAEVAVVARQAARAPIDLERLVRFLLVAHELRHLLVTGLRAHEREHVPINLCRGLGRRAKHLEDMPIDLHGWACHAGEHAEGRPNEFTVRVRPATRVLDFGNACLAPIQRERPIPEAPRSLVSLRSSPPLVEFCFQVPLGDSDDILQLLDAELRERLVDHLLWRHELWLRGACDAGHARALDLGLALWRCGWCHRSSTLFNKLQPANPITPTIPGD
mmetsp:Transcript_7329/g.18347  ORF Transcript_7329/g.18347 Transcript_7329/m.18347 type:complete len:271 (-) Transcript_7329:14-826(-)